MEVSKTKEGALIRLAAKTRRRIVAMVSAMVTGKKIAKKSMSREKFSCLTE